jgi:hypothetical protein
MKYLILILSTISLFAQGPYSSVVDPYRFVSDWTVLFSDNFTRADSNPMSATSSSGGTWDVGPDNFNDIQILGNLPFGTTQPSGAIVASPSFNPDQSASFTVTGLVIAGTGILLRMDATAMGGYMLYLSGTLALPQLQFYDVIYVGSYSSSIISIGYEPSPLIVGDVITFEIVGTTLTAKVNGVTVGSITDSTYSSGQPGLFFDFDTDDSTTSYFEASHKP